MLLAVLYDCMMMTMTIDQGCFEAVKLAISANFSHNFGYESRKCGSFMIPAGHVSCEGPKIVFAANRKSDPCCQTRILKNKPDNDVSHPSLLVCNPEASADSRSAGDGKSGPKLAARDPASLHLGEITEDAAAVRCEVRMNDHMLFVLLR